VRLKIKGVNHAGFDFSSSTPSRNQSNSPTCLIYLTSVASSMISNCVQAGIAAAKGYVWRIGLLL